MGSKRFRVHIGVKVSGHNLEGKGVVRDLSLRGALFETNARVTVSDHMALTLTLPNGAGSLQISGALARWVRGSRVGVEFLTMDTKAFQQLAEYLFGLETGSDRADHLNAKAA
jgi:hypothetical protein